MPSCVKDVESTQIDETRTTRQRTGASACPFKSQRELLPRPMPMLVTNQLQVEYTQILSGPQHISIS